MGAAPRPAILNPPLELDGLGDAWGRSRISSPVESPSKELNITSTFKEEPWSESGFSPAGTPLLSIDPVHRNGLTFGVSC